MLKTHIHQWTSCRGHNSTQVTVYQESWQPAQNHGAVGFRNFHVLPFQLNVTAYCATLQSYGNASNQMTPPQRSAQTARTPRSGTSAPTPNRQTSASNTVLIECTTAKPQQRAQEKRQDKRTSHRKPCEPQKQQACEPKGATSMHDQEATPKQVHDCQKSA